MKKKMRVNHFNRSLSLLLMLVFMLCTNRAWADDVTIDSNEQSVLMPVNGTNYVTISEGITSFKVYDDGGADSYYSDNCKGTLVLTAPEGYKLQLTGSITTETGWDKLTVYDSDGTTKLLDGVSSESDPNYSYAYLATDISTITSTGRSMTLYFDSDSGMNADGLDLTVTVIPDESGSGEVTVNTYTSSFDEFDNDAIQVVTTEGNDWTLTSAPSGYKAYGTLMSGTTKCVGFEVSSGTGTYTLSPAFPITGELSKITILVMSAENIVLNEADGTFVYDSTEGDFDKYVLTLTPGSGITLNNITFTSDNKWLFVQSITVETTTTGGGGESSKIQGEDKLIPVSGSDTYDIPEGVDWFKVYDNGGAEGEYSSGCDGSLVLTAPEGCTLQLTGTVLTESYELDRLSVYDGNNTEGTLLLQVYSTTQDTSVDIGTITSTGRSLTLNFESDQSVVNAGLDLTVTVISDGGGDTPILDPEYTINVTQYQGGYVNVADNLEKAKAGDEITLWPSVSSGNILSNLSVVDENGDPVSVNGGKWYNTTATFIMPASNVYITPQYTPASEVADNLYVNMEEYGSTSALIPSGVKSFKIYDDGGAEGNYSYGFSSLTIFAPSGKTIQLTGNIATYYGDRLIVYEGNTDTELADKRSETSGTLTDIGSVISTGRSIRLLFNTYTDKQYPGLDLTVKVIDLSLADNGTDNASDITEQSGTENINVALNGRTFYKDGLWNTICLPFDVTIANSPLAGATAKTLTNASMENTHVTLVFGEAVETLHAGVPYLIKWENNGSADIVNPVFTGVNITATTPQTITFADGCVKFIGYYDAFNITAANDDIYYMTGNNELKPTAKDRTLKAFRTYFQFKENNGGSSSDAKTFSFSYYFDDYATGISSVGDAGSDSRALDNNSWYTLDGRKLSGKPVQRGIYVNSGKKVVIK